MSLICVWMKIYLHMKGWAPRLALKKRPKVIRKWPIVPLALVGYGMIIAYPVGATRLVGLSAISYPTRACRIIVKYRITLSYRIVSYCKVSLYIASHVQYCTNGCDRNESADSKFPLRFSKAPMTGTYVFYMTCKDECELWLSTDYNPENKERILFVPFGLNLGVHDWEM